MKYQGVSTRAAVITALFALLMGASFAGEPQQPGQGQQPQQPQKPAPNPGAQASAMLGSGFYARDLKKVEKPNVGLTIELPDGWVFGDVAKIGSHFVSRQNTVQGRQAAQEENKRRLAAIFHEKRNVLLHFLYRDNSKNETIMTQIGERKARNPNEPSEEKFYTLHGTGLAMLVTDDVGSNGAELKQIWSYFAPKESKIIFEVIGVMPKKTFGEIDDALKELAAKLTFDSPTPGDGLKTSTRDAVVEMNAPPLMLPEWLIEDKKEKKKKSKTNASPPWKVKRPSGWEWMDIDAWKAAEKPDTTKIQDPRQRQSVDNIWMQRVCGMYNAELDAYVVLRAAPGNQPVDLKAIYTREKNSLLSNKNVKVLTTKPYRFKKFMGYRIGWEFDDRKTGRKLAMICHFSARDTNFFIMEVRLPKKNYDEFLKYDKKKKFITNNFLF
ncbi:MAG: hypothetical protein ACYS8W_08085 [Planctomycetota bacterium]|jgi:hypothetical protein